MSLNNCLSDGNLYLNRFFFSLDFISEFPFESVVSSSELISLVEKTKLEYKPNQPASKNILAENILLRPHCALNKLKILQALVKYPDIKKGIEVLLETILTENLADYTEGNENFQLLKRTKYN